MEDQLLPPGVEYYDVEGIPVTFDRETTNVYAWDKTPPRPFPLTSMLKNGCRVTKEEFVSLVAREFGSANKPPSNKRDTKELALDFVHQRYRNSIAIVPVKELPGATYNFDPQGWDLFAVIDKSRFLIGATEHIAVNRVTGEVRELGMLGE